ncbi:MAG: hypothetical protein ABSC54_10050 [Smithellaceae bacterium]|jgi:regulator of replication initiation timing
MEKIEKFVNELIMANKKGVSPPQNWTHRAITLFTAQEEEIRTVTVALQSQMICVGELKQYLNNAHEEIAALKAENEALKKELKRWKDVSPDRSNLQYVISLENQINFLTAENEKLKGKE